jgi:hypothetical protein
MALQFLYNKKRKFFGRPCKFKDYGPTLTETILPDKPLMENFIVKNPNQKGCQISKILAEHEVS